MVTVIAVAAKGELDIEEFRKIPSGSLSIWGCFTQNLINELRTGER